MADQNYYASRKHAATALGVHVELIKQACSEDPEITGSGGRMNKERLAIWLKDFEWKKTAPPPDGEEPSAGGEIVVQNTATYSELVRLRELVGVHKDLLALEKASDSLLPLAEFQANLTKMLTSFRAALQAIPGRASSKIVQRARADMLLMLKTSLPVKTFEKVEEIIVEAPVDFADIIEILEAEVDIVQRTLHACDFLGEVKP